MTDRPWFYLYKSRGQRRLVPAAKAGWVLTIGFVVAMAAPGLLMAVVQELWVLWVMFPWMAISLVVFLRLAWTHSETIPLDEAVDLWRQQRGRRR